MYQTWQGLEYSPSLPESISWVHSHLIPCQKIFFAAPLHSHCRDLWQTCDPTYLVVCVHPLASNPQKCPNQSLSFPDGALPALLGCQRARELTGSLRALSDGVRRSRETSRLIQIHKIGNICQVFQCLKEGYPHILLCCSLAVGDRCSRISDTDP